MNSLQSTESVASIKRDFVKQRNFTFHALLGHTFSVIVLKVEARLMQLEKRRGDGIILRTNNLELN